MHTGWSDDDIAAMTHAQRRGTIAQLEGLSEADWQHPTLCEGWSVAHLAAHLSMPFRVGMPKLMIAMVRARGDFDRAADTLARRDVATMSTGALLDALRDNVTTAWRPPGGEPVDSLCHDVIHGLDLTEGLGLPTTATTERLGVVLHTIKTKDRVSYFGGDLAGRTLQASDVDFEIGDGPTVAMAALDLMLVLTGRRTVDVPDDGSHA